MSVTENEVYCQIVTCSLHVPVFRKMISTDSVNRFGWKEGDSHACYTTCIMYYECNSCVPLCKAFLKSLHFSLKSYSPRGPQNFTKTKWNTLHSYLGILAGGKIPMQIKILIRKPSLERLPRRGAHAT